MKVILIESIMFLMVKQFYCPIYYKLYLLGYVLVILKLYMVP